MSSRISKNIITTHNTGQRFTFEIEKLKGFQFTVQSISFGGGSVGLANVDTPLRKINLPGNNLQFEPIVLTFLVDENLDNYVAIESWFLGNSSPFDTEQYINHTGGDYANVTSDASLNIKNNTGKTVKTIVYSNLLPIAVDNMVMDTRDSNVLTCSVSFSFETTKRIYDVSDTAINAGVKNLYRVDDK